MSQTQWLIIVVLGAGAYFFGGYFWLALAILAVIVFLIFIFLAASTDGTEGQDLEYMDGTGGKDSGDDEEN